MLHLEPDARILAFTAAVSILTGIMCGLVPALRASRVDVVSGIKGQARGSIGGGHWLGPGKILVVSQVALCLLLLFGAGLFVRSLQRLDGQDAGFDRETVLIVRVEPRGSDQRGVPGASARLDRTYRDLLQRVDVHPRSPRRQPRALQSDHPRGLLRPVSGCPTAPSSEFRR